MTQSSFGTSVLNHPTVFTTILIQIIRKDGFMFQTFWLRLYRYIVCLKVFSLKRVEIKKNTVLKEESLVSRIFQGRNSASLWFLIREELTRSVILNSYFINLIFSFMYKS